MSFVLDSSVALSWCFEDERTPATAALLDQVAEGGRLVIPIGGRGYQVLEVHHRKEGKIHREVNIPVAFVPLRGEYGWK